MQNQNYFLWNWNGFIFIKYIVVKEALFSITQTKKAPGWHPSHKLSLLDIWTRPDKPLNNSISILLITNALSRVHIRNLKDLLHYILTMAGVKAAVQMLTFTMDKTPWCRRGMEGKRSVLETTEQFQKQRDKAGCKSLGNSLPPFSGLALLPTVPASWLASLFLILISSFWHMFVFLETP